MRYVAETECEVCGLYEAEEHQRRGGHFNAPGEWCDGSGGSRRVVTPAQPDYIAGRDAMRRVDDAIANGESTEGEIDAVMACIDAALAGLVVIEGEPE